LAIPNSCRISLRARDFIFNNVCTSKKGARHPNSNLLSAFFLLRPALSKKVRRWSALVFLFALVIPAARVFAANSAPQGQREQIIRDIVPHGNRRIPKETILARMGTHIGDIYDPGTLERDFVSLWNTGYFEDLRFEKQEVEAGSVGVVIHVYLKEKPLIGKVEYVGLNVVSVSDVLDEYKKQHVSLSQESVYDPTKVKRAEVVLKDVLAQHGRQFATIRTEIRQLATNRVGVTFVIKEGPKVRVGRITFTGNKHISSRELSRAMKGIAPIGIPHSPILTNLISHTYDATKLPEDVERVRDLMQQRGYFRATVEEPQTKIRDVHGLQGQGDLEKLIKIISIVPLIKGGTGKVVDIHIPVEEGDKYKLAAIKFENVEGFNEKALRGLFPIKDGDTFNIQKIREGLNGMRKAFGADGYINFTAEPRTDIDEAAKKLTVTMNVDKGKQFFVRRIEFQGNTTTRDKVIRREILLDEGQVYNGRYWELSLLRLNQLGFFERLDPEKDTTTVKDEKTGQVDLTLKVKEKQKNSIGVQGGVSGLAGSFIGVNYETNNFLGLGVTLNISAQIGNRSRVIQLGVTHPYFLDRPIQLGFTVFSSKFNYNQAQQLNILSGQQLNIPQNQLNLLQNFTQNSTGFTTSVSYALRRSLKRVGLTYSFNNSSITTFSNASQELFQELAFRSISGPSALQGIITSSVTPSFSFNSVNASFNPSGGQGLLVSAELGGLGGNTRYIRPVVDYRYFLPLHGFKPVHKTERGLGKHTTLALHVQGAFITGYGGLVASPFQRFYQGGESDLRGFDIRSISPIVFLVDKVNQPLLSPSDPCLNNPSIGCPTGGFGIPVDPTNPRRLGACAPTSAGANYICAPIPVNRLLNNIGGDTSGVMNLEYRIPVVSDRVVIAPFADIGLLGVARQSQLKVAASQIANLNSTIFGCPILDPAQALGCAGGFTQTFSPDLKVLSYSNFYPRMSNGLELQVLMPIVNAPLRVYWAYNTLRLDKMTSTPNPISRSMFPPGGAGDVTFGQALQIYSPSYLLREPSKTFRFSVATTF
jgi:outer membrane protein insertion porin family